MVALQKEIAVIGAANELLLFRKNPVLNGSVVYQYSRMLEARSGYAVVCGFSRATLERFLDTHKELFRYDDLESEARGEPSYTLQDLDTSEWTPGAVTGMIQKMLIHLDPAVNYPMDCLEDMRLMDALGGGAPSSKRYAPDSEAVAGYLDQFEYRPERADAIREKYRTLLDNSGRDRKAGGPE